MNEAQTTGPIDRLMDRSIAAALLHILEWATSHARRSLLKRAFEVPPGTALKTAKRTEEGNSSGRPQDGERGSPGHGVQLGVISRDRYI